MSSYGRTIISHLIELFKQLNNSSFDHAYTAIEISGHDGIYLGVDHRSHPCLFIIADSCLIEAPLKTAYLSLNPNQNYRITLVDGLEKESFFHMITCESTNQGDIYTYLSLLEGFIVQNVNCESASSKISPFFRSMVRLFSIRPAKDLAYEQQGLWGELFVMRSVKGYRYWAPFWHNEVTDIFDFSSHEKRLEVKTSASGQRVHHLTHRQAFAMPGEEIVLASLLVKEDETGFSLRDLIDECRAALLDSLYYFKIEKAARHAGMLDIADLGPLYNLGVAERSLAFFSSLNTPHFNMPEPPGVSQTSFRADLTNAEYLDEKWRDSWIEDWATIDIHKNLLR